jgi:hypothetical protein
VIVYICSQPQTVEAARWYRRKALFFGIMTAAEQAGDVATTTVDSDGDKDLDVAVKKRTILSPELVEIAALLLDPRLIAHQGKLASSISFGKIVHFLDECCSDPECRLNKPVLASGSVTQPRQDPVNVSRITVASAEEGSAIVNYALRR